MSQETVEIYRTTPERMTKMMVIMLGICIAGGVIFFGMWDYWISIPASGSLTPSESKDHAPAAVQTGETIPVELSFIESDDFINYAFNALPGHANNNPTINAKVGDKIVFDVINDGKTFHAFGVTSDDEGFANIYSESKIASTTNPLKPGEDGSASFVPSEPGTYYYICTVPGHRDLGMVGEIIVEESDSKPKEAAAPTGVEHSFDLNFIESEDFLKLGFNGLPGEENSNPAITVSSGDTVTINVQNKGAIFHAFGVVVDPEDYTNPLWNSAIASFTSPLKPNETGTVTFTAGAPGTYYYICIVPGHALQGMVGTFTVN